MTFLNPLFLFFLPLAAVPVLIHLINRDKVIKKDFPTLKFLFPATRSTLKKFRLLEILLLVIRVLILIFLTLGFSRPLWKGNMRHKEDLSDNIILIDNSYTAGYGKGAGDTLEFSREAAAKFAANTAGSFAVGTVNSGLKKLTDFTDNSEEITEAINSIKLTEETMDISAAVNELISRLEQLDYSDSYRIIFFSDFKKSAALKEPGRAASGAYSFILADTNDGRYNKAAAGVTPKRYYSGVESVIDASVYSYDENPAVAELVIDGVKRSSRKINGKGIQDIEFKYTFAKPGNYSCEIKIESPREFNRIEADSSFYFKAEVLPRVSVLLADGRPGYTFSSGESYFAARALGSENMDIPIQFQVIDAGRLEAVVLNDYDVLFMLNVDGREFNADRIIEYADSGGAAAIFSGDNIRAQDYNRLLKPLVGIEILFSGPGQRDEILIPSGRGKFKDIFSRDSRVELKKYTRVRQDYSARADMFFGDIPVFWMSPGGTYPYRASFFSIPAGLDWSDFPVSGAFPVFINKLIGYLAGGEIKESERVNIGDTLLEDADPHEITLNGEKLPASLLNRYPVASVSGNYYFPGQARIIPVNIRRDNRQYMLEEIGAGNLKDIFSNYDFDYIPHSDNLYTELIKRASGRQKSTFFLAGALVLLIIEEIIRKKLQNNV